VCVKPRRSYTSLNLRSARNSVFSKNRSARSCFGRGGRNSCSRSGRSQLCGRDFLGRSRAPDGGQAAAWESPTAAECGMTDALSKLIAFENAQTRFSYFTSCPITPFRLDRRRSVSDRHDYPWDYFLCRRVFYRSQTEENPQEATYIYSGAEIEGAVERLARFIQTCLYELYEIYQEEHLRNECI
jgi:hypothetical protein